MLWVIYGRIKKDMAVKYKLLLLTYIDQLDPVLLNGVQGYGNVFQFVVLVEGSLVVFELPLLEDLDEGAQPRPVRKVRLKVLDVRQVGSRLGVTGTAQVNYQYHNKLIKFFFKSFVYLLSIFFIQGLYTYS